MEGWGGGGEDEKEKTNSFFNAGFYLFAGCWVARVGWVDKG